MADLIKSYKMDEVSHDRGAYEECNIDSAADYITDGASTAASFADNITKYMHGGVFLNVGICLTAGLAKVFLKEAAPDEELEEVVDTTLEAFPAGETVTELTEGDVDGAIGSALTDGVATAAELSIGALCGLAGGPVAAIVGGAVGGLTCGIIMDQVVNKSPALVDTIESGIGSALRFVGVDTTKLSENYKGFTDKFNIAKDEVFTKITDSVSWLNDGFNISSGAKGQMPEKQISQSAVVQDYGSQGQRLSL